MPSLKRTGSPARQAPLADQPAHVDSRWHYTQECVRLYATLRRRHPIGSRTRAMARMAVISSRRIAANPGEKPMEAHR